MGDAKVKVSVQLRTLKGIVERDVLQLSIVYLLPVLLIFAIDMVLIIVQMMVDVRFSMVYVFPL
jgi:hypothetical protein